MHITLQGLFAIAAVLVALLMLSVVLSPELRGLLSEIRLSLLTRWCFRKPDYQSLERMSLLELLDHPVHHEILVSKFGVFCIEYVSYCGHVDSRIAESHWYLHQGRKWYRFANPVERAQERARRYVSALKLPQQHVHALTVFSGSARLEKGLQPGVFRGTEVIRHIQGFKKLVFSKSQVQSVMNKISAGVSAQPVASSAERPERLDSPQRRKGSTLMATPVVQDEDANQSVKQQTPAAQPVTAAHCCPVCGDKMLLRKITKGGKQGMHLWGCASFPDCRTLQWLK